MVKGEKGRRTHWSYLQVPKLSRSAEAAREMASWGRVTPNCSEKKRLSIMACILPPLTKPLSDNGRENIQ